jgi:hypothetical protein
MILYRRVDWLRDVPIFLRRLSSVLLAIRRHDTREIG